MSLAVMASFLLAGVGLFLLGWESFTTPANLVWLGDLLFARIALRVRFLTYRAPRRADDVVSHGSPRSHQYRRR